MEKLELEELREQAARVRAMTIDAIGIAGGGHIGGAMSLVELLTLLYYRYLSVDPREPGRRDRDFLILSKGHAGPVLYSILADKGFFPREWLHTLNRGGTRLPSHCDRRLTPGVDMTTGSLGQGLSAAIGFALASRIDGLSNRTYVVLGDGECDEGQVWEAAMAAAHFRLSRLVAFTDCNKLQIDGATSAIMDLEQLEAKWSGFGWSTWRVDGHDFEQMDAALQQAFAQDQRPSMLVLDTVKGKGCSFAENTVASHNMQFSREQAQEAIRCIGSGYLGTGR